jgi:hypothetical protein
MPVPAPVPVAGGVGVGVGVALVVGVTGEEPAGGVGVLGSVMVQSLLVRGRGSDVYIVRF